MKSVATKLAQLRCFRYFRILPKDELSYMLEEECDYIVSDGMLNKMESEAHNFTNINTFKALSKFYGIGLDFLCEDRTNYDRCYFSIPKYRFENGELVPYFDDTCKVMSAKNKIYLNLIEHGDHVYLITKEALPDQDYSTIQDSFLKRVGDSPFPSFDIDDILQVDSDPMLLLYYPKEKSIRALSYNNPSVKKAIDEEMGLYVIGFRINGELIRSGKAQGFLAELYKD